MKKLAVTGDSIKPMVTLFVEVAIEMATCWFHYVDDTFVIWHDGLKEPKNFINHLNSICHNIQFIMETESNSHLPFLAVDIPRRPDGSLGTVYTGNPSIPTCN
jgi:hypothetical protein